MFAVCALYLQFGTDVFKTFEGDELEGYAGVVVWLANLAPFILAKLSIAFCAILAVLLAALGGVMLFATIKAKYKLVYVMLCIWSVSAITLTILLFSTTIFSGIFTTCFGGTSLIVLTVLTALTTALLAATSVLAVISAVKTNKVLKVETIQS